jgi:hypothetical protein
MSISDRAQPKTRNRWDSGHGILERNVQKLAIQREGEIDYHIDRTDDGIRLSYAETRKENGYRIQSRW